MKLSPIFSDHAVLQRDQSIPVWGWTNVPRTRLKASLGPSVAEGISGDDGRFLLRLPALPAGGPHTLRVETLISGEVAEAKDLLIGEVWLASGQSNMEWRMRDCGYAEEIAAAHAGQLRMFTVRQRADLAPQSSVEGAWQPASPETLGEFSAVANFFGQTLQDTLGVPVGILNASMGGSFVESWLSRESLLRNAGTRDWLLEYDGVAHAPDSWGDQARKKRLLPPDPGNLGGPAGWHRPDFDDAGWQTVPVPGVWQEQGHNYSGVVWYRKSVVLPDALRGQPLRLRPGRIDKQDITHVNGVEIGRTGSGVDDFFWNVPRDYEIPAGLTRNGELLVAIRVYSFAFHGGLIGPADVMGITTPDGTTLPLAGDWRIAVEHNLGLQDLGPYAMGHGMHNSPSMCFENMIRPLAPVGLAGVIWYQGESNAGRLPSYAWLLTNLITDWRHLFASENLPFGIVQLTSYGTPRAFEPLSLWARVREAQQDALALPGTGLAVTLDCGDADDIHPRKKKPVGQRLAAWALDRVYGRTAACGGPLYRSHRIEGARLRIFFDQTAEGLAFRNNIPPESLILTDGRGRFEKAQCTLDHHCLVVWHDDIETPASVYYAWADHPAGASLTNSNGLPASPFRTNRTSRLPDHSPVL